MTTNTTETGERLAALGRQAFDAYVQAAGLSPEHFSFGPSQVSEVIAALLHSITPHASGTDVLTEALALWEDEACTDPEYAIEGGFSTAAAHMISSMLQWTRARHGSAGVWHLLFKAVPICAEDLQEK